MLSYNIQFQKSEGSVYEDKFPAEPAPLMTGAKMEWSNNTIIIDQLKICRVTIGS